MSVIEDEAETQIADRLKLEREARGWSLADLAERSGVRAAAISKIERGESSPTAGLLVRLADAFDLTLAGLVARAEDGADRLSRAADQPLWRDPASGYLRRQVFERADHPVELVKVELPAGAHVGFPAASYRRIRQLVWVLAGELAVEEGGRAAAPRRRRLPGVRPARRQRLHQRDGPPLRLRRGPGAELSGDGRDRDRALAVRARGDRGAGGDPRRGGGERRLGELHASARARDRRRLLGPGHWRPPTPAAGSCWAHRPAASSAGTVTLDLDTPPNQPHRADIAKLMTALRWRGRGVARALMIEAERVAAARGRTLLTLDTAEEDGAAGLYERLGFTFAGAIPDYAFKPLGGLTVTILYYKALAPQA